MAVRNCAGAGLHPRGSRFWNRLLAGLALGALLFGAGAHPAFAANALLNRKAPVFQRKDLSGAKLDLARYKGKVVLLNFWATWCAPCQTEMPAFVAWQRESGAQGLQVIGISMDDDADLVRKLVAKLNVNYPVAMGDEALGALYGGVLGLPLTYLIDKHGVIRARFQGETDLAKIQKQWKALLAQP